MAITLIANQSAAAFDNPTTTAIDTTGADFIVIGCAVQDIWGGTPTDNKSNTWTEASNSYTQTNVRVRMFYSIPTSVGSNHTFTLPADAGPDSPVGSLFVAAFSGVAQSTPADQINGANGFVSTLQPGSITPSVNNCLVYTVFGINSSGTPISIDSSFIEVGPEINFGAGDHYGGQAAYIIQTTAAAVNPTWTRTNTNGSVAMQVSFKPSISSTDPYKGNQMFTLTGVGI